MQDNQDKDISTDKIQSTTEYKKIPPGALMFVLCVVK